MRPVTQRTVGWPEGECVRASHATILDMDIDDVPPLDPATADMIGVDQDRLEREWLASIGLGLIEISVPPDQSIPDEVLGCMPEVPHFMSGISPRGHGHRVVGVGGRVVWDPHPSRAGLTSVYSVGILVPL